MSQPSRNSPSPYPSCILSPLQVEEGRFQPVDKVEPGSSMTHTQKFELLSAYIDSEVNAAERCLVEHWLATDQAFHHQYQKQLKLKAAIQSLSMGRIYQETQG